jgi:hypothetical protein
MVTLDPVDLFQTRLFLTKEPEFLIKIRKLAQSHLQKIKSKDTFYNIYPVYQTGSILEDQEADNFCSFVLQSAATIIDSQGYDLSNHKLIFKEAFVQEHHKGSGHERHFHSGSVITGFYFLKVPQDSFEVIFYDPRPAKEFLSFFPEKDENQITSVSNSIYFTPEEGMFIFSDSWLHHSFTKNRSNDPVVMVHFSITSSMTQNLKQNEPIII